MEPVYAAMASLPGTGKASLSSGRGFGVPGRHRGTSPAGRDVGCGAIVVDVVPSSG